MLAIALGLGSGLFWGLADFGGGLQSRRHPVVAVLFVSQAVGLAGLVAVVALSGEPAPALDSLWPAAAGGVGGRLALAAFSRGLASRTVGICAPVLAALLLPAALLLRRSFDIPRTALVPLAAVGILDLTANGFYAWGTTQGLLSVVAVLGSLYPLATVLLARAVLGERVRRLQEIGVASALAGVVLIAAG